MAANDKLLKKVEQDRAKGQLERALGRLKEGISADRRDFQVVNEAAALCFEMRRTIEGVNILRPALKRFPQERNTILAMLDREFGTSRQAELGELLYESYLTQGDLDKARDIVTALADADRGKLLAKLRTKITSVMEESPNDVQRLTGLLIAEAMVLSAMSQHVEFAATLERALDLDPGQVANAGRLGKLEARSAPECGAVHALLSRCYLGVQKPDLAAEQAVASSRDPTTRTRALTLLDNAGDSPLVQRARAEILCRVEQFDAAHAVLATLLASEEQLEGMVRHTFEAVPHAVKSSPALQLLYGQSLARTGANRLALKEVQDAQEAGADPTAILAAADVLLEKDSHNIDVMLLRARAAVAAGKIDEASAGFKHVIEMDPSRADTWRGEIEKLCSNAAQGPMGKVQVDLYLQLEMPQEASNALRQVRNAKTWPASTVFELAGEIAGRYGFSADLLLIFIESALDTQHEREARAAVAHYMGAPGAHTAEFTQSLTGLLRERPELSVALGRVIDGLALPVELRFILATATLEGETTPESLVVLETLLLERPELRDAGLAALEAHLAKHPDAAEALILCGDLCEATGHTTRSAQHLARALRVAPDETDRVCKLAERVLKRDPKNEACWREIVLALIDMQRYRHARELCYLAQQALPPEQHGFVHFATAEMLIGQKQQQAAVNELEGALACENAPVDRIVALLDNVVAADNKHGYARYVLAAALLRQGSDLDHALVHLSTAVQQDDLLVDLAFELLNEHADKLNSHAPARVLEGLLHLRKGDRKRGLALLQRALELQPQLAVQTLPTLEAEWDRDAENPELGLTFANALRRSGHVRRACRLVADLAKRFPETQESVVGELEAMLDVEELPEVHRALWEILVDRGRKDAAQQHLQRAVETCVEVEPLRDLLETAQRRLPESTWVACRLAEIECGSGRPEKAVEALRSALTHDPAHGDALLACAAALPDLESHVGLRLVAIDCMLACRQGNEALEALRNLQSAFPDQRPAVIERYHLLAAQQSVGLAVELELGALLRESGAIDEAVRVMEAGLGRANAVGNVTGADAQVERDLRLNLAQLFIELGREVDGRQLLATVLDRPGDHRDTYGFLERLAKQGMLSRLKSLRDTINTYPSNMRARLELARLSIVSMDFDGARDALSFTGDSPAVETARLYLLARSHSDEDHPDLALAVLRSIKLDDVADEELRRNVVYLRGVCDEQLGHYGQAHAQFLQILSEFPYFKDVRERVRRTYQKHLESALGPRAEVLEKRTHLDVS